MADSVCCLAFSICFAQIASAPLPGDGSAVGGGTGSGERATADLNTDHMRLDSLCFVRRRIRMTRPKRVVASCRSGIALCLAYLIDKEARFARDVNRASLARPIAEGPYEGVRWEPVVASTYRVRGGIAWLMTRRTRRGLMDFRRLPWQVRRSCLLSRLD